MNTSAHNAVPDEDTILAGLREAMAAALPEKDLESIDLDAVAPDTQLLSLPVDSMALLGVANETEERFRVFIPEHELYAFTTVGDFVAYVGRRLEAKAARAES